MRVRAMTPSAYAFTSQARCLIAAQADVSARTTSGPSPALGSSAAPSDHAYPQLSGLRQSDLQARSGRDTVTAGTGAPSRSGSRRVSGTGDAPKVSLGVLDSKFVQLLKVGVVFVW
jgi:hypothetical protein